MNYWDLPVYRDTEALANVINSRLRHFPREAKISLGPKFFDLIFDMFKYLKNASDDAYPQARHFNLSQYLNKTEDLEVFIRMSSSLHFLGPDASANILGRINRIKAQTRIWLNKLPVNRSTL